MLYDVQHEAEDVDWRVFCAINGLAGRWRALDVIMIGLSRFGPTAIMLSLSLLLVFGNDTDRKRHRRMVARTALGFGLARLVKLALNHLFPRRRPYEKHPVHLLVKPTTKPSFPSNHMVESTAVAWGIHDGPQPLALPLMALALLVGFSRVYVGKHYPSDVVSGAFIAIGCDSLAGRILPLRTAREEAGILTGRSRV